MFDVLMYLFETYIQNQAEVQVDQDKLTRDLADVGFDRDDINNALVWLSQNMILTGMAQRATKAHFT